MRDAGGDVFVSVDAAHCDLLFGLVRAHKPSRVLEFGFGAGASARAIQTAIRSNGNRASHTIVDDWTDWGGQRPEGLDGSGIRFVEASEVDFTYACTEAFDLIFSDADHQNAESWFIHTYTVLLRPGGILCYHDVCNPDFPNLWYIVEECRRLGLSYMIFYKNSVAGERCERGLLVIFKPEEAQT